MMKLEHSGGYADDLMVRKGDIVMGPFSTHWAAVAALIRLTDPTFKSIGGDKPEDLAIEASHGSL